MKARALDGYVIVEKIKEAPKKIAGLELTEVQNKDIRYLKGKIINAGILSEKLPPDSIVWYDRHAGHIIYVDDIPYYILKIGDIAAIQDEN